MSVVRLQRLSGSDAAGRDGRALGRLFAVTLDLGPGLHAVVGRAGDGTAALCGMVAGQLKPSGGTVRVAGRDPRRSPATRRRLGAFLAHHALADRGTVAACLDEVARLSGGDPRRALADLGLAPLMDRTMRSLRFAEVRALDLTLALALPEPIALVLHRPFEAATLLAPDALTERLRQLARAGTCVIVASPDPADVADLADHLHLLERGRLLGSDEGLGWPTAHHRELTVWLPSAAEAKLLAAALAERDDVAGVAWEARPDEPGVVWVRAAQLDVAAQAVAAAVDASGVDVQSMQPVAPTLEGLHERAQRWRREARP